MTNVNSPDYLLAGINPLAKSYRIKILIHPC
jgi:hypothetical protein